MPKKRIMTSPKRTFEEWEKAMSQKIADVREATKTICGVIMGTPLRQTAQEKLVAIDGLNALERQLSGGATTPAYFTAPHSVRSERTVVNP